MSNLDGWLAACLIPLAIWLLLSGLDDLFLDLVYLFNRLLWPLRRNGFRRPGSQELASTSPLRIAIFIPLWREHRVIGQMLARNLAALRYQNYEVFAGCYPNDQATVAAVRETAARLPAVHLALCPHDGPTSKADCLNWIYQQMRRYEQSRNTFFDVVVIHDAEDLMHPDELLWINYYARRYDMIQIPVLPLPTPLRNFTHGVYCDEFAEYQTKDVPARLLLGAALPSNGVGTGYARAALERLADAQSGRIFDPTALTEDYAIGHRLHQMGGAQLFVPIQFFDGVPLATCEYFPRSAGSAVRQRTRWVMGIALQGWRQFGWRGSLAQVYFFWRDRKGLLGNPLTVAVNAIFLYGAFSWLADTLRQKPWAFGAAVGDCRILLTTLALQLWRIAFRAACVWRIYGWRFALASPFRVLWANSINFVATAAALRNYALLWWQGRAPAWLKTEHTYPARAASVSARPRLGELLVRAGHLSPEELARALAEKPVRLRLGEYLVRRGRLSEKQVYKALSSQQGLPLEELHPALVPPAVARLLPVNLVRRWKVLPFRVAHGNLFLASPEPPDESLEHELRRFTRLEIRFHLVTPSDFERLRRTLIDSPAGARQAG